MDTVTFKCGLHRMSAVIGFLQAAVTVAVIVGAVVLINDNQQLSDSDYRVFTDVVADKPYLEQRLTAIRADRKITVGEYHSVIAMIEQHNFVNRQRTSR